MGALSHTSKIPKAILQFTDGTQITNWRFFYKIYEGYGFAVSHRFEGVASGSTANLYFENPSGSGMEVFIITIDIVSTGQSWVDVYRGISYTGGTSITPVNLNFSNGKSSVCTVKHTITRTDGTLVHSTVVPGGSKQNAVGGVAEVGETVVIPEGFNFSVEVTNKSDSAEDISIRVVWWEETL